MHTTRCQSDSPYPFQAVPFSEDVPRGKVKPLKGRLVGGGHRQDTSQFSESEVSSPTVSLTSVLIGAAVAAHNNHVIVTLYHKAAYLNAAIVGSPVHMMLTLEVSTMLCKMDSTYNKFVRADGVLTTRLLSQMRIGDW